MRTAGFWLHRDFHRALRRTASMRGETPGAKSDRIRRVIRSSQTTHGLVRNRDLLTWKHAAPRVWKMCRKQTTQLVGISHRRIIPVLRIRAGQAGDAYGRRTGCPDQASVMPSLLSLFASSGSAGTLVLEDGTQERSRGLFGGHRWQRIRRKRAEYAGGADTPLTCALPLLFSSASRQTTQQAATQDLA
jgi:hypothetical protein